MNIRNIILKSNTSCLYVLIGATVAIFSTGCGSQNKLDNISKANLALKEDNVRLQQNIANMKAELESAESRNSELGELNNILSGENSDLLSSMSESEEKYNTLVDRMRNLSVNTNPSPVEEDLTTMAMEYPETITYDTKTGALRFKSDFSFDSGKTSLQSGAKLVLKELAKLLNEGAGKGHSLMIIGHTDNVPVRASSGRRFRNNLELSAMRAISVQNHLVSENVMPDRILVAGWGEYKPLVENNKKGGTAQNRRVEVYLNPPTESDISNETVNPSNSIQEPAK